MQRTVGMGLAIDQRERRAPTAAEDDPAVDAERVANLLYIAHQMPCGIGLDAGMRARAATAALIEEDDSVDLGIEVSPHRRAASAARPAMQDNDRKAIGPARLLHIDRVTVAYIEHLPVEGFDRGKEILYCAFMARDFIHECPIYRTSPIEP